MLITLMIGSICSFGQQNWHFQDYTDDGYAGISLHKAYTLLKDRKPKPVIVAILDSGVDTTNEDIKHFLWQNPNEIPANGKDDDHNGFIDDVHGWNFLGNAKGQNIDAESLEVTRMYSRMFKKFNNIDTLHLKGNDKKEFDLYIRIRNDYQNRVKEANEELTYYTIVIKNVTRMENALKQYLHTDTLTESKLKPLLTCQNDTIKTFASRYYQSKKAGYELAQIKNAALVTEKKLKTELNPDFDARYIVGDNPFNINDSIYGNNDIMGPSCNHGTFTAGIIAADRHNGNNAFGIADCVQIMILRIVPGGDERDKDVANAIKYAVNNGAKILNMSFGKQYSPEKNMVDDAITYAESKGVIFIHAAGNESNNNDKIPHFPSPVGINNKLLTKRWIDVGASGIKVDENLAAPFSNYGKKTVDVFAPGVKIFSTGLHNSFRASNGTSASCPVVTGIAALLMSYFPELTSSEIRNIILSSVNIYKIRVLLPSKSEYNKRIPFTKLSKTGGIVNAEKAVKMAISLSKKR